ncbi:MAG: hypothetical protein MJ184_09840 [Treponema sp.]|uniref:hypothetical protein n=1 Tax=Treponema sp. TaxID=166 RepID=UPI00298DCC20|nr:hypothetical protein [Treponema sp.]MCQ2601647.1 hypothetical protein [Treponema sp.]
MNENAFFDDLLLNFLYKKKKASTIDIEKKFGDILDTQNVNNIISNRENQVSYINQGYMKYDETKQTLSITKKGKDFIEEKYSRKRS